RSAARELAHRLGARSSPVRVESSAATGLGRGRGGSGRGKAPSGAGPEQVRASRARFEREAEWPAEGRCELSTEEASWRAELPRLLRATGIVRGRRDSPFEFAGALAAPGSLLRE